VINGTLFTGVGVGVGGVGAGPESEPPPHATIPSDKVTHTVSCFKLDENMKNISYFYGMVSCYRFA
jgi:hypothetical protein